MTALLLAIALDVVGLLIIVLKALAVDEVRGRVQRRIRQKLEATIESLPEEIQDEWADEWRAELAYLISMPIAAVAFVRGVRAAADQLVGEPVLAPSGTEPRGQIGIGATGPTASARQLVRRVAAAVARFAGWVEIRVTKAAPANLAGMARAVAAGTTVMAGMAAGDTLIAGIGWETVAQGVAAAATVVVVMALLLRLLRT